MPVPISAAPPFCMTVRTSAKSTLMMPVLVMRLAMPWVAWSSTSSAFLSASWKGMPLPTTARSRSLGTTIIVSTFLRISEMPCSACFIRFRPSKRNGLVTMPTVSAPAVAGDLRDDRRRAGAGAAAHAAGDEDQVGALDRGRDLVAVLLDRLAADLGPRARAQPRVSLRADLDLDVGLREREGLGVGVHRDELDAAELLLDHAVDGVAAAAADADDLHAGGLESVLFQLKDHGLVPSGPAQKKSWSHRFTGAEHFLDRRRLPRACPEAAAHRDLPGAVEHQSGRHRHSRRFHAVRQTAQALARDAAARAGIANTSRASSTMPGVSAPPPVRTTPAGKR